MGFVWPVFSCVAPETMVRFACAIRPNGPYTFSICNYSNFSDHASAFFSRDALHMDSAWGLIMQDNTSVFGSQYDTEETTLARLATAEQRLEPIIQQIRERKVGVFEEENQGPGNGNFSLTLPPFYNQYRSFTAPFYVEEDKCVGCGLCAKRCPVQAIEMRDKKPVWVKECCEKCSACINCCPTEYINLRYVHLCPGDGKLCCNNVFSERFDTQEQADLRIAQINLERKMGTFHPPAKYTKKYMPTMAQLLDEFVNLYGVNHWGDSFLSCSQHRINDYIMP